MDQQNKIIAFAGIIVAVGILAVGFNKITPDIFQPEYSFENRSTTMGWKDTYPEPRYEEEPIYEEEPRYEDRRRSDNSTGIIVGGRTMCKRCNSRNTRKK